MGYYEVLEVEKNAKGDEIRRKYTTLAERFHPRHFFEQRFDDLSPFRMLTEAFDVLSDPWMRSVYDDRGVLGLNEFMRSGKMDHPLAMLEDFSFSDKGKSNYLLSRAEKLFDDVWSKEKPELVLDKSDDLLKTNDFEDICRRYAPSKDAQIVGDSYQKSRVVKNGRTVEVVKKTVLKPDGTLETEVTEGYDDGKGNKDTKTLKNTDKWRPEIKGEQKNVESITGEKKSNQAIAPEKKQETMQME